MIQKVHRYSMRLVACLLLLAACATFSGCVVVDKIDNLNGILEPQPPDPVVEELKQAEYAFFTGDYQAAKKMYLALEKKAKDKELRNNALYGLACVAIITAENTEELKQGYAMLQKWEEPSDSNGLYRENPKMIALAINSQVALLECKPVIRYVVTEKEGDLVDSCRAEVEKLKETIKNLEHQISVFEAIDQEIQEKRKPL